MRVSSYVPIIVIYATFCFGVNDAICVDESPGRVYRKFVGGHVAAFAFEYPAIELGK
jgi:hypothetical protein